MDYEKKYNEIMRDRIIGALKAISITTAQMDSYKEEIEWLRSLRPQPKQEILEHVKLAYGKVSMNPFDCSEAFEELINKINAL